MAVQVKDLETLYLAQLKDAYSAETQLTKALPKMIKHAESAELREALESHLEETRGHVSRIEEILKTTELKPGGEKCKAMAGLVEEADELVGEHVKAEKAADAAIICAAQKVEHYEIATYGCLVEYAKKLGRTEDAQALRATLEEERSADKKLTDIAISIANPSASGVGA